MVSVAVIGVAGSDSVYASAVPSMSESTLGLFDAAFIVTVAVAVFPVWVPSLAMNVITRAVVSGEPEELS